ncbi:MAG: hypothetical protein HYT12_01555 [Candidatus Liptonbacteria bacterium]|nr:hypothetical protein [Candidatus Liptonbacteria bacterium]
MPYIMQRAKQFISCILVTFLATLLLFGSAVVSNIFLPKHASAQVDSITGFSLSLFPVFGGRVELVLPCVCEASLWIQVGDPRPGYFMVTPLSRVYERYTPLIDHWVIGTALPFEIECRIPIPYYGCVKIESGKPVVIMGTS